MDKKHEIQEKLWNIVLSVVLALNIVTISVNVIFAADEDGSQLQAMATTASGKTSKGKVRI